MDQCREDSQRGLPPLLDGGEPEYEGVREEDHRSGTVLHGET